MPSTRSGAPGSAWRWSPRTARWRSVEVDAHLTLLEEAGVAVRRLDADELAQRIPLLVGYGGPAMLDERGGSIRTPDAVRALTGALGDAMVVDEVLALRSVGDGVEVRSGGRTDRYDRVVVCAGRGTAHLARSVGVDIPVRQGAHVRLTFVVRGEPPTALATLQDSSGDFGETGVYAAALPGNGGSASASARPRRRVTTAACSCPGSSRTWRVRGRLRGTRSARSGTGAGRRPALLDHRAPLGRGRGGGLGAGGHAVPGGAQPVQAGARPWPAGRRGRRGATGARAEPGGDARSP